MDLPVGGGRVEHEVGEEADEEEVEDESAVVDVAPLGPNSIDKILAWILAWKTAWESILFFRHF